MPGKILELEIPNGVHSFFCPVCGNVILNVAGATFDGSCPHLLFYMNSDVGAFDRVSQRIEHQLERLEECEYWKDWANYLPETSVIFCIYEPGRGGGHDPSCNYYCIEFDTGEGG